MLLQFTGANTLPMQPPLQLGEHPLTINQALAGGMSGLFDQAAVSDSETSTQHQSKSTIVARIAPSTLSKRQNNPGFVVFLAGLLPPFCLNLDQFMSIHFSDHLIRPSRMDNPICSQCFNCLAASVD